MLDDSNLDIVKIDTGNAYADLMIEHRLSTLPEFWALVTYLEYKGVLDRQEFYNCLNQKCAQGVEAANILKRDEQDS
ncbi:MAG: hypothetical protein LUG13_08370 [Oscillospiraceae bacterium]|nr:hypothetical protein [Oscillospiraceae bacterium]